MKRCDILKANMNWKIAKLNLKQACPQGHGGTETFSKK